MLGYVWLPPFSMLMVMLCSVTYLVLTFNIAVLLGSSVTDVHWFLTNTSSSLSKYSIRDTTCQLYMSEGRINVVFILNLRLV